MLQSLLVFIFSLFLVVKGATLATKYSAKLAEYFCLSKYVVGFIVVALISILPETLIAINSAVKGVPEFGLGTLFGSNVADLALVFAILIIYAGRGIKIESKVLKNLHVYPFFLLLPLLFGLNGHYSRIEGAALIISGALFYYLIFKNNINASAVLRDKKEKYKNFFLLFFAMAILLIGSHFTVSAAADLAAFLKINPILIGLLVVSLGTVMPELFYSLKSVKRKDDGLAIGDILGTVLADATIVVGLLALINPFFFPIRIVYISGVFMLAAAIILLRFMKTGRLISKKEGYLLLAFWVVYIFTELIANK